MRALAILGLLSLAACATARASSGSPEDCMSRADAAYQQCLHPMSAATNAEQAFEPAAGEDVQGCRLAHQSAVADCHADPSLTATSTSISPTFN